MIIIALCRLGCILRVGYYLNHKSTAVLSQTTNVKYVFTLYFFISFSIEGKLGKAEVLEITISFLHRVKQQNITNKKIMVNTD